MQEGLRTTQEGPKTTHGLLFVVVESQQRLQELFSKTQQLIRIITAEHTNSRKKL